jgi:hypothetical protein
VLVRLRTIHQESTERNMQKRWFNKLPHTQSALEDAVERREVLNESRVSPISTVDELSHSTLASATPPSR